MDRIKKYRSIVDQILKEYARQFNNQPEGVDVLAIRDEENDAFAIINIGWDGEERISSTTVLMRIRNDKIWVEADWTMYGFVEELLDAGVPKQDIVLGFQSRKMREHTGFAVV